MADGDHPFDWNRFPLHEHARRRLNQVVNLHPPGSDQLGFTVVDPRASWWVRWGQSMQFSNEMEESAGVYHRAQSTTD